MTPASSRNLVEALLAAPRERTFITFCRSSEDATPVTFGAFIDRAWSIARWLETQGTRAGDTVTLAMEQSVDLMASFVGAMMLGAAPTIIASPNFKVEPTKYRTGLLGVTTNLRAPLVVVDRAFPAPLLEALASCESTRIVCFPAELPPRPDDGEAPLAAAALGARVAFIQHSAGTTGLQKAVALEHEQVLRQLSHLARALALKPSDRIYSWLPLYHDMGLISCFMLPMVFHLPVVMQSPTSWVMAPRTTPELISRHRATLAWMPNFALQFLARRVSAEVRARCDLSSLRLLVNCAEPVRAQSHDEFLAAYAASGLRPEALSSSYAMAENVFAVTQSSPAASPARVWVDAQRLRGEHRAVPVQAGSAGAVCLVSSGRCLATNEVQVLGPTGAALADGGVGELAVRSDSLFDGYFHRPDLTAKCLSDRWYRTGDLGFLRDGELYVVGRSKDLIIVAGRNIYPQDVEEIVCAHPAVHDGRCVAFGLVNGETGTEELFAVAEVEAEPHLDDAGAVTVAVSQALLTELGVPLRRLFLKPRGWLVKSTAGKPARSTTREKLLAEHGELRAQLETLEVLRG